MREITLKSIGVGRYDDVSPFLITDNALTVKVKLPAVNGEFYFLYNPKRMMTVKRLIPKDGIITLEDLTAGELEAGIEHYLKGKLIKTYKVEPLILKEADGSLAAEPEISVLRRKTAELESLLAEERKRVEELTERFKRAEEEYAERLSAAEEKLVALVRFAYEDFKNNVYLGGGTAEEFEEKFGLSSGGKEDEN